MSAHDPRTCADCRSAAPCAAYGAGAWWGEGGKLHCLRGRVVLRPERPGFQSKILIDPYTREYREYEERTHRGVVVAMGPPVLTSQGHETPHGFEVGDVVQFHYESTERGSRITWPDGSTCVVRAQREIDAVIEPGELVQAQGDTTRPWLAAGADCR